MATKTSKRAGETSTTVNVGIRIDPKIKFALDMMGRLQKRSLTAVIEWAISSAMVQQQIDNQSGGRSVSEAIESIWSTDEATRFINMCFEVPSLLTYDEMRIWDTIKLSADFWMTDTPSIYREHLWDGVVRDHWDKLKAHVDEYKNSASVVPYETIPF